MIFKLNYLWKGGRFFRSVKSVGIVIFWRWRKSYFQIKSKNETTKFSFLANIILEFFSFYKRGHISPLRKAFLKSFKKRALYIIGQKSEEQIFMYLIFSYDLVLSKIMIFYVGDKFDILPLSEFGNNAGNEEISKNRMNFKKIICEKTFLFN